MMYKNIFYLIAAIIGLSLSYSVFFWCDNNALYVLTRERGFFEPMAAFFFLVASIFFFIKFWKGRQGNDFFFFKTRKNIFFILLAVLFLFGCGEEINWGQRIFHFKTPEVLKEINIQKETNIHNIYLFHYKTANGKMKSFLARLTNIDRLFSLFWFACCVLAPIIDRFSSTASTFLKKINFPVIPIWLGIMFLLNYIVSKVFELYYYAPAAVEIKEFNFAFLFVLISLWFLQKEPLLKGNAKVEF